jgi:outer membrane receptor protein involved in Fe transport
MKDRIAGIDTNNDGFADMNSNINRSEIEGVEFEASNRIWIFRQTANYTYTRSRGTSVVGGVPESHFVDTAQTPAHRINYDIDTLLPWDVTLTNYVQYVSKVYQLADRGGAVLPSYAVWNARLSKAIRYRAITGSEVYVGVNNILDRRYAESFDADPNNFSNVTFNPQPPRTYYVGATLRFSTRPAEEVATSQH